ncbi:spore germination protein [Bacillus cereus]|uniref:spore germination protein n=1 Tax=Bacillus cereus TaxID=1396 RepID=UPI001481F570
MKLNDTSINFSQTTVAIVYMQNLANDDLVTEVKRKLKWKKKSEERLCESKV